MRVLITAGPTYEPIDPVRFIGNRSSGRMGAALATAAVNAGHDVTLVLGPVTAAMPVHERIRRLDIFSSRELHEAVLREFPAHDLLIMAAAVADFRPKHVRTEKAERGGTMTIELEATEDIAAAAGAIKRPHQRTVGFSLVERGNLARSREKMARKNLDLIVYNPLDTMSSATIESVLLYPDGRADELPLRDKPSFAAVLLERAARLFVDRSGKLAAPAPDGR
jgi:phosphopantothenoylcysteine decarboxylase / phosphopantothenate---cysteine ligase